MIRQDLGLHWSTIHLGLIGFWTSKVLRISVSLQTEDLSVLAQAFGATGLGLGVGGRRDWRFW